MWQLQVKFNANTEYEMINNYKVLQSAFNKLEIAKVCSSVNSSQHMRPFESLTWQAHSCVALPLQQYLACSLSRACLA